MPSSSRSNLSPPEPDAGFEVLLAVDMDVDAFSAQWSSCDRLSSYVARMVSHNRTDSLLYANLFSSALNELLETAFRRSLGRGRLVCRVFRSGPTDRIALDIPCDEADFAFYEDVIGKLRHPDLVSRYQAALFSSGPLDPSIGLMELAVDYGADLFLEAAPERALRLVVDLKLESAAR